MGPGAAKALRVVQVTDGAGDADRIVALAGAALAGGVRCVQLREPGMSARELAAVCVRLRPAMAAVDGLLLVNDRADLAAAGYADGVHLGWRSLPAERVRAFLADAIVGVAAHDPDELAAARAAGADYATLSPIHPTASKPFARPLGVDTAAGWTRAAGLPVVWLGGFDAAAVRAAARGPAVGFAALGALRGSVDEVRRRARELVAAAAVAAEEAG